VAKADQLCSHEHSLALLKAIAEASAIFVAFTFIGGWSYLASYYSAFGLNALELDVPIAVVSTTAVYVLFDAKWPLAIVVALIVSWGFLADRFGRLYRSIGVTVLALLLLVISTAGILHGRKRAAKDAVITSSSLPFISLALKSPKNDQPACVDYQTYGSLDCKLLLHSNKTYYFFEPIPEIGEGSLNIFAISDSDIPGVHILRGLDRNGGGK
jgi:hypothetical protein